MTQNKARQAAATGNSNMTTNPRPNVMDLMQQIPTNTPSATGATETVPALTASELDSVTAMLNATAEKWDDLAQHRSNCKSMLYALGLLEHEINHLPLGERLRASLRDKQRISQNLREDVYNFAKTAVELAEIVVNTKFDK